VAYLNSPFACGVCGRKLPARTLACPGCGADERTGLRGGARETDTASELGILDEDTFDYDACLQDEFGENADGRKQRFLHPVWWIVGIALLISLLLAAIRF
jgi:hypothetical protein